MRNLTPEEFKRIRLKYLTEKVKIFFIGEAPPAGGKFFYLAKSDLFENTREVFLKVYNKKIGGYEFLSFFKSLGCYLDDLCFEPVDDLPAEVRKTKCKGSIDELSERIKKFDPLVVIVVIKRIKEEVDEAIKKSGVNVKPYYLPFPRYIWQQEKYKKELEEILIELRQKKILA